MRIALVMTIRNERPVLRPNLLYHHYAGVDKVFLYLDRTTDGSEETVRDLDFVQVAPTTDGETMRDRPGTKVYIEHPDHLTARHALNVIRTLDIAQAEGIDWLLNIDADELALPDAETIERGDLKRLFESVPNSIESVRFRPFECCTRRMEYEDVFKQETLFTPYYAKGSRRMFDPIRGVRFNVEMLLGHRKGKCAVRVSPDVMPRGPHNFRRLDGTRLRIAQRGLLLHYYLNGFSQFLRKFRNFADRPDTWVSGSTVRRQKRLWRDVVNSPDFSEEQLRAYFKEWLLVSDEEAARRMQRRRILGLPLGRPTLVEIPAAKRVFETMEKAGGPASAVERNDEAPVT